MLDSREHPIGAPIVIGAAVIGIAIDEEHDAVWAITSSAYHNGI